MNRLIYIFISIACIIAFSSCKDDGYSLDKTYAATATVVSGNDNSYHLVLDDGTKLWDASGYMYKAKNNQRAIVYFSVLSGKKGEFDHYVKVYRIYDILTKQIVYLTPENDSSLGNDPVKILRYWIGDNYLNIEFGFNRGGKEAHSINMVENNTDKILTPDGMIRLEFRHNANGDPALNWGKGYVAFDLRPYITEDRDFVDFIIKVNDLDGVKEKPLKFTFGKNTNKSSSLTLENIDTDATLYK